MDFFNGFDYGRYASFKPEIINGLKVASLKQLADLNEIYPLANQWLKTARSHPTGLATTFNTTLDAQDPQEGKKSKQDHKQKAKNNKNEERSGKKDISEMECFNCGTVRHYANKCPQEAKKHSDNCFGRTEVLIDNAADVSIFHPSLLRNIVPVEKEIKINGVGGHQFRPRGLHRCVLKPKKNARKMPMNWHA